MDDSHHGRDVDERESDLTVREQAVSQRDRSGQQTGHEPIERTKTLRREVARIADDLARTEEGVARTQAYLATLHPENATRYQHLAEKAREEARRARDVAEHFGS